MEEELVDPTWWAPAMLDDNGSPREDCSCELLSSPLARLATEAQAELGNDAFKTRVLDVLSKAASPMLVPDNWTDPYAPAVQIAGRRSFVPSDFCESELRLLAHVVPHIDMPTLKARAADIAWCYGDRLNIDLLSTAIDAYRSIPLESSTWFQVGHDGWRRALELSLRRGKAGRPMVDAMVTQLSGFLLATDSSAGFMLTQISDLLIVARSVDRIGARNIADRFVSLSSSANGNYRLIRAYERQACTWLSRLGETKLSNECIERIAHSYVDEANDRLTRDGGALVAGRFIEKAILTLRSLPRSYRAEKGLDGRIQQLRDRLAEIREVSLEEMMHIESDAVDISHYVEMARKLVSGRDRLDALATLAHIAPLIDATNAMNEQREQIRGSLSRFFGSSTFSSDGRKVDTRNGVGTEEPSEEHVFAEVVRSFAWKIDLSVTGLIYPALEVVMLEHRFDFGFLANVCLESPTIPPGHNALWARGLWHGLSGDFPSAISVLVPQVEQLVRRSLKTRGAFTLLVDENGIESEKGLNALLEMPEASQVLGHNLTVELRALFCEQLGLNLRNNLAHGLLNDQGSWSAGAVYAWWLCLKLALLPFHNMLVDAEAKNDTVDENPEEK